MKPRVYVEVSVICRIDNGRIVNMLKRDGSSPESFCLHEDTSVKLVMFLADYRETLIG